MTNAAPPEAPPPAPPTPTVVEAPYEGVIREADPLRDHWINPHVANYHAQRTSRPTTSPQTPGFPPLRTMTTEQRAAYIAQRDAENAAAAGNDTHPGPATPRTPTQQVRSTSLQAPPPGKGAAQRLASAPDAPDVPYTPNNSSDPDAGPAPRTRAAPPRSPTPPTARVLEHYLEPLDRLPTPPPVAEQGTTASVTGTVVGTAARQSSVLEGLSSPIHMVPPNRRRSGFAPRPDVEVEIRGSGAERTVVIRVLAPGPATSATGATTTR